MSRRAAVILIIVSLFVGVVAGGWSVAAYYERIISQLATLSMTADASTTVAILKRLREGDETKAMEVLEVKLDGDVVGLGAFLAEMRELKRDPQNIKVLQMARDYRAKFPHKPSSPEIDEAIARAFALVDEKSGH